MKDSEETARFFYYGFKNKFDPKNWVDKWTEFAGEFEKFLQSWRNTDLLYNEGD